MVLALLGWLILIAISAYLLYFLDNYYQLRRYAKDLAGRLGLTEVAGQSIWTTLYRALSWRKESRFFGKLTKATLPVSLRRPLFSLYIRVFKVDMSDVKEQDLTKYESLNEFFCRPIKHEARPLADACLVSPADCHTFHFGKIEDSMIKDVKGITYDLGAFFGDDIFQEVRNHMKGKGTSLWYFIGYLSPADSHRFYSPVDAVLKFRRHFTGRLLSVNERNVQRIADLFDINERILVAGEWKYGFFSMTAVGAFHVGEIELDFDDHRTNCKAEPLGTHDDRTYEPPVKRGKGESFGRFLLGSALVLVFEAPANFQFTVGRGDKLKMRQAIGNTL